MNEQITCRTSGEQTTNEPTSLRERVYNAIQEIKNATTLAIITLATTLIPKVADVQAQIPGIGAGTLTPTTAQELQKHVIGVSHQIFNGKSRSQVWVNKDFELGKDANLNLTFGQSQDISTGQASVVWNPDGDKSLTVAPYFQADKTPNGTIITYGGVIKKEFSPNFSLRALLEQQKSPNGQTDNLLRFDAGIGLK